MLSPDEIGGVCFCSRRIICRFIAVCDTSMILLSPFFEKSHSIKDSESQTYNIYFSLNNETLILLYPKKDICVRV